MRGLSVSTFFHFSYNIYCVKGQANELSNTGFGRLYIEDYKQLEKVNEDSYDYLYHKQGKRHSLILKRDTCQELVEHCKEKYNDEFEYIQSGLNIGIRWDTVIDIHGETCPHLASSKHG